MEKDKLNLVMAAQLTKAAETNSGKCAALGAALAFLIHSLDLSEDFRTFRGTVKQSPDPLSLAPDSFSNGFDKALGDLLDNLGQFVPPAGDSESVH